MTTGDEDCFGSPLRRCVCAAMWEQEGDNNTLCSALTHCITHMGMWEECLLTSLRPLLSGRSSKSNIQGSIRLKLWLSTREDRGLSEEEDMWNEIRQQEKIFSVFMDHQIRQGPHPMEWDGELPEAACTILHQHMIQGDLTDLQVTVLRWKALFNKVKTEQIDFAIIHQSLRHIKRRWARDYLSPPEVRTYNTHMRLVELRSTPNIRTTCKRVQTCG